MSETGFYAMGTYGVEAGRIAAIARHIPDAVVYVRGRHLIRDLFAHHGITTVNVKCPGGCSGLNRTEMQRWIAERNPDRLIMEMSPYGIAQNELRQYVRQHPDACYLQRRSDPAPVFDAGDFRAILNIDPTVGPGEDLHPLLCFDPDELPSRDEARHQLAAGDRPLVLIIGEGTTPAYTARTIELCQHYGVDHRVITTWPVMPSMVGADLVVGYAGYSQDEAAAVGVPMIAIANHADPSQTWRANLTPGLLEESIASLNTLGSKLSFFGAAPVPVNRARRAAALITGDPAWRTVDG